MSQDPKERRQHIRIHTKDLVSLNRSTGIASALNISVGGYSFKSFSKNLLPDVSWIDIFDNYGQHLKNFPVQKVWSVVREDSIYCVEEGVRFLNLDFDQQFELQVMLDSLAETPFVPI